MAEELKAEAAQAGLELHYVPCLNDRPAHARMLLDLINSHLAADWTDAQSPVSDVPTVRGRAETAGQAIN